MNGLFPDGLKGRATCKKTVDASFGGLPSFRPPDISADVSISG